MRRDVDDREVDARQRGHRQELVGEQPAQHQRERHQQVATGLRMQNSEISWARLHRPYCLGARLTASGRRRRAVVKPGARAPFFSLVWPSTTTRSPLYALFR